MAFFVFVQFPEKLGTALGQSLHRACSVFRLRSLQFGTKQGGHAYDFMGIRSTVEMCFTMLQCFSHQAVHIHPRVAAHGGCTCIYQTKVPTFPNNNSSMYLVLSFEVAGTGAVVWFRGDGVRTHTEDMGMH